MRHIRQLFPEGIDAHQVCRIVQRCKFTQFLYFPDDFVIDQHGLVEYFAAVYNTVSTRIYIADAFDDAVLNKFFQHEVDRLLMIFKVLIYCLLLTIHCYGEDTVIQADSLYESFSYLFLIGHFE